MRGLTGADPRLVAGEQRDDLRLDVLARRRGRGAIQARRASTSAAPLGIAVCARSPTAAICPSRITTIASSSGASPPASTSVAPTKTVRGAGALPSASIAKTAAASSYADVLRVERPRLGDVAHALDDGAAVLEDDQLRVRRREAHAGARWRSPSPPAARRAASAARSSARARAARGSAPRRGRRGRRTAPPRASA